MIDEAPNEATFDTYTHIEATAFEAAYLDMISPDPASSHFVELVARHRDRLWAEHRMRQGEARPSAPLTRPSD